MKKNASSFIQKKDELIKEIKEKDIIIDDLQKQQEKAQMQTTNSNEDSNYEDL